MRAYGWVRLAAMTMSLSGSPRGLTLGKKNIGVWALTLCVAAVNAQVVTEGVLGVTALGAATYSLPIQVPPGIGGMEPKLLLNYSSQAGQGAVGWGWDLSGASAVVRCPRTYAQDGVRGSINFDSDDRFCLDGQRLVLMSGTYGADASEYRTELDSFSRITYRADSVAPSYFVVQTKGGLTLELGRDAPSRILAEGRSDLAKTNDARVWAVNKVSDRSGNFYRYRYEQDSDKVDFRLIGVDYTGNVGGTNATERAPGNRVELSYVPLDKPLVRYVAGSKVSVRKRLASIQTYTSGVLVKRYQLSYLPQASTATRTKLASVQECDPSNRCLAPFTINWMSTATASPTTYWGDASSQVALPYTLFRDGVVDSGFRLMDLNGDGLPDFVASTPDINGNTSWLSTGADWAASPAYAMPFTQPASTTGDDGLRFLDLNGDGLPDILYSRKLAPTGTLTQAYLNTGSGWIEAPGYVSPMPIADDTLGAGKTGVQFVDLDGDGLLDCVVSRKVNGALTNSVWMNTGSGWVAGAATGYSIPVSVSLADNTAIDTGLRIIDINGDGLPDLVLARQSASGVLTASTWLNTGSSWQASANTDYAMPTALASDGLPEAALGVQLIDLNGDGLPDIALHRVINGVTEKSTWLNTGRRFVDAGSAYTLPAPLGVYPVSDTGVRLADVNGDGLPDVVNASTGVWLNTGSGWATTQSLVYAIVPPATVGAVTSKGDRLADINGDGVPDYVGYRASSLDTNVVGVIYNYKIAVALNQTPPDLVQSVTAWPGIPGSGQTIAYSSLVKSTTYTKDLAPEPYPRVNLILPSTVVAQVSASNGVGGTNTVSYTYGGLKGEQGTGRGIVGFRWMNTRELATGVDNYTEFSQSFPFTGLPIKTETRLQGAGAAGVLRQAINNLACYIPQTPANSSCGPYLTRAGGTPLAKGSSWFPYVSSTSEQRWDLNGAVLPTVTTAIQYQLATGDTQLWGDPTRATVTTTLGSESYTRTTDNQYLAATTSDGSWLPGRLKQVAVTHAVQP